MLRNRQNASCRAVWFEWDANRPLSVGQAYDRGGESIEFRLYDAGHSNDITSISTLMNGVALRYGSKFRSRWIP